MFIKLIYSLGYLAWFSILLNLVAAQFHWQSSKYEMVQLRKQNCLCPVVIKFRSKYDLEFPRKIRPANWAVDFYKRLLHFYFICSPFLCVGTNAISIHSGTNFLWHRICNFSILTFNFSFLTEGLIKLVSNLTCTVLSFSLFFPPAPNFHNFIRFFF